MNVKQYPEEKRKIVVEYSSEDFIAFLEEIQGRERDELQEIRAKIRQMPKERLPATIQVQEFISRLRKEIAHPDSDVWKWFAEIWTLWIGSHDEFIILADVANESDFDDDGNIVPPNSDLDVEYFRILKEESQDYQINREMIQRFYAYGYFLPDDRIESFIKQARSCTEIEQWQRDHHSREGGAEATESVQDQLSELTPPKEKEAFNRRLENVEASFEIRLSEVEGKVANQVSEVKKAIASLESQIVNRADDQSVHITDCPRIAHQSVQIGERYDTQLQVESEHYSDENDYRLNFRHCLRRFGVTDSDETADAIHVAMKAFPALEATDTRIIEVWQLMCGNHLYVTNIDVEIGWLGLQDWFPKLFSQECFGERLRRMDLDISIRKMLEIGDMPWAIHLSNCDRSFPESYLPRFLDWIGDFSEGAIRTFLTRCSGMNRCETNQDIYTRVASLPKFQLPEPIEARNLKPSDIVTRSEWESWCRPNLDTNQLEFLNQLQEAVENTGIQIPAVLLRELQHYLRLSHGILAASKALDWALTLRLLPWIGNRRELIDIVQSLMNQENRELPYFQDGLLQALEGNE